MIPATDIVSDAGQRSHRLRPRGLRRGTDRAMAGDDAAGPAYSGSAAATRPRLSGSAGRRVVGASLQSIPGTMLAAMA